MASRLTFRIALLFALLFSPQLALADRCDNDFFRYSWALLKDAGWGFRTFEQAAFAVRTSDGRTDFIRWPVSWDGFRAHYKGSIPANAFAIVHTHPNRLPQPSDHDVAVARQLGIAVYVLTRSQVSVTDGQQTKIIALGDWNPERCK